MFVCLDLSTRPQKLLTSARVQQENVSCSKMSDSLFSFVFSMKCIDIHIESRLVSSDHTRFEKDDKLFHWCDDFRFLEFSCRFAVLNVLCDKSSFGKTYRDKEM